MRTPLCCSFSLDRRAGPAAAAPTTTPPPPPPPLSSSFLLILRQTYPNRSAACPLPIALHAGKKAGADKKLAKELESQYKKDLAESPPGHVVDSPIGPVSDPKTRKLLIDLISTMNASFPDYDFSTVSADHFVPEADINLVINKINKYVVEPIELTNPGFSEKVWTAINDTIQIKEARVYSYVSDSDDDPMNEGSLWSFNYFFYNAAEKKIIYFTCYANSKFQSAPVGMEGVDDSGYGGEGKGMMAGDDLGGGDEIQFAFAGDEDMDDEAYEADDWDHEAGDGAAGGAAGGGGGGSRSMGLSQDHEDDGAPLSADLPR